MGEFVHDMNDDHIVTSPERMLRWMAGELGYEVIRTASQLGLAPAARDILAMAGAEAPVTVAWFKPTGVMCVKSIEVMLVMDIDRGGMKYGVPLTGASGRWHGSEFRIFYEMTVPPPVRNVSLGNIQWHVWFDRGISKVQEEMNTVSYWGGAKGGVGELNDPMVVMGALNQAMGVVLESIRGFIRNMKIRESDSAFGKALVVNEELGLGIDEGALRRLFEGIEEASIFR